MEEEADSVEVGVGEGWACIYYYVVQLSNFKELMFKISFWLIYIIRLVLI